MRSILDIGWVLNPMSSIVTKDRRGKTQRHQEGPIDTEAEAGVTLPHGKELLELPEAGRGKEGFQRKHSPATTLTSDSWPLEL